GLMESCLTLDLVGFLREFIRQHDLGILAGADGPFRLLRSLVRLPDIAFVAWEQLPQRDVFPDARIADLAPALAVEVLSESNTRKEMLRKRKECFLAGVRLVWIVDPEKRTVTVYTSPEEEQELTESDTLDGGDVLPGFALALSDLFARVPRATAKRRK